MDRLITVFDKDCSWC